MLISNNAYFFVLWWSNPEQVVQNLASVISISLIVSSCSTSMDFFKEKK